eukprot:CAMPEP_0168176048 /NCGR_PEP_ID=MMETSP0139_2-20121125/7534_1 /TAXON_ID=44445 /ORGANISM="Pseudo-nitzschia australis, Strain 10249 10 AB" /LENGTH=41 /DNA_ID= /DNA_START= /DNA_END= /DNA_ORIENTATION=
MASDGQDNENVEDEDHVGRKESRDSTTATAATASVVSTFPV